jgi:hypothetical protein
MIAKRITFSIPEEDKDWLDAYSVCPKFFPIEAGENLRDIW